MSDILFTPEEARHMYELAKDKGEQVIILTEMLVHPDTGKCFTAEEVCAYIGAPFVPSFKVTPMQRAYGWTMDEIMQVYEMRCAGMTRSDIARALGRKSGAVEKLCSVQIDRWIFRPDASSDGFIGRHRCDSRREAAVHAVMTGGDIKAIAAELGVSLGTLYRWCREDEANEKAHALA